MDRDRLQGWLQIASNVGLLVGLILVGVQIKQNSDLTRRTILESAYQSETAHFDALMGEGWAAAHATAQVEPEALTPADISVLIANAEWTFAMFRRNAQLEERGMFDSSWRLILPIVGTDLARNPVTRKYLLEYGDEIAEANGMDWLKVMRDAARATPPDSGKRFIEDMLRAAKGNAPTAEVEASASAQEP